MEYPKPSIRIKKQRKALQKELNTLIKTHLIWSHIALYEYNSKTDVYKLLRLAPDLHDCPCCEFVSNINSATGIKLAYCRKCLLRSLWPSGCMHKDSAYRTWVDMPGTSRGVQAAWEIADTAQRLIKALAPRMKRLNREALQL